MSRRQTVYDLQNHCRGLAINKRRIDFLYISTYNRYPKSHQQMSIEIVILHSKMRIPLRVEHPA